MKKKLIICVIIFCPLSSYGQNMDSIIRNIRTEYNLIIKNKESYKKMIFNIDVYDKLAFEDGRYIDDGILKEKVITYYVDKKNNQIKLISLYEADCMYNNYTFKADLTEYYLKDGSLFFIYQQSKNKSTAGFSDSIENVLTTATESRIYTAGDIDYHWTSAPNKGSYYSINNCVKYLVKSVEGKLSDITELLQKTANITIDCSKLTEKEIYYSAKDLLDIYYGRDKSVKISKEVPPTYFYNILFGE